MIDMLKNHRKMILTALVVALALTVVLILLSSGPQQGGFVYQLF